MSVGCIHNPERACARCNPRRRPTPEELLRLAKASNPFNRIEDREKDLRRTLKTR